MVAGVTRGREKANPWALFGVRLLPAGAYFTYA